MRERTKPSSLSMRFCMSSGDAFDIECPWLPFLRAAGEAYEQELLSPRLTQLSHAGDARLHFNLGGMSTGNRRGGRTCLTFDVCTARTREGHGFACEQLG